MNLKIGKKPSLRRFHQARWDEPVIFELSQPGQRGVLVPEVESGIQKEVGDVVAELPDALRRSEAPKLPEMSQLHVLRHYTRLSQENLGVDLNTDIGQGTCTIKLTERSAEYCTFYSLHDVAGSLAGLTKQGVKQ